MPLATENDDRAEWLATLEFGLSIDPNSVALRFERAKTLDALGRTDEAEAAYRSVLECDATHFGATNDLAKLLFHTMRTRESFELYLAAVTHHSENPIAHTNLAILLLNGNDPESARNHFERALSLDPESIEAHRGLALALGMLGETAEAEGHRAIGFDAQPFTTLSYRGSARPIDVLLIVSASAGNVHFERMLDDRIFAVTKAVAESAARIDRIPHHQVVINGVGDADASSSALYAAERLVGRSNAQVVNHPSIVARSTRLDVATRLSSLTGVKTPRMHLFTRDELHERVAARSLAAADFALPLLLRSPGHHTGRHFERLDSLADLAQALDRLPGDELLAIEFIDTKVGNHYRKYRALFIDHTIYPLHVAISESWKVHYFSADMVENAQHRAIDRHFLESPHDAIGSAAMAALGLIEESLELDYGGIDFAVDEAGHVVVFEANATMIVPRPGDDARWNYRRERVDEIYRAVVSMIRLRASKLQSTV